MALMCLASLGCGDSSGEMPFKNPVKLTAHHGPYELNMEPAKVTIDGKNYCLRTYNGMFPSPTIEVEAPSGTKRSFSVDLQNRFKSHDWKEVSVKGELTATYDFNETNLHTHGLHVRPETTADGNFQSDNVLLSIKPGDPTVHYRFDIDEAREHEAGTYWYHPHIHGSTAIQVANGMAGALIIRGKVDQIPSIRDAEERIFVLGQLPYDDAAVKELGDAECTESRLSIDDFTAVAKASNTLINGLLHPTLTTHKKQVERWRFIHAGVFDEITVGLRKAGSNGSCDKADTVNIPMQQIAADGFTFMQKEAVEFVTLQPGNRADLMVQAPGEEGTYCVLNLGSPEKLLSEQPDTPKLLACLKVDALEEEGQMPSDEELKAAATAPLPCGSAETNEARKMIFAQQTNDNGELCEGIANGKPLFNINCKAFSHEASSATKLTLNKTEDWSLSSQNGDHPFHIHVNSFTVCKGSTINGQVIPNDRWMDTLFIRQTDTADKNLSIRIRMAYEDYTGRFVMHCHRLNHEDLGMMQLVQICENEQSCP